jgi:hypothetical protein
LNPNQIDRATFLKSLTEVKVSNKGAVTSAAKVKENEEK